MHAVTYAMILDPAILITPRNLHAANTLVAAESPCSMGGVFRGTCSLGAFSNLGSGCQVSDADIGRYCSVAPDVIIGARNEGHAAPDARTIVKNEVTLGKGVVIMQGVTVGDGAVIGDGEVVTRDVLPYQVVRGHAGADTGFRYPAEIVERLLRLAWWKYDLYALALHGFVYANIIEVLSTLETLSEQGALTRFEPIRVEYSLASFAAPVPEKRAYV